MTLIEHPLEVILRLVEDAAPGPWRPLAYIQATGSNPEYVRGLVEMLRLEGVIEVGPGVAETGPEVRLTELGRQAVREPELMARLREGRALRPGDPGAAIRESLRHPTRPVVTPLLVAVNFAVFLYCLSLAGGDKALMRGYLMEMPPPAAVATRILYPAGGVTPGDLVEGKWWRLLTACFVHAGLLHLGMNMYTLWAAGRFVEQVWGWWRFGLIYFIAAWGGSCLALAQQPVPLVGASGAICGVLGAEAVWVLAYGRYLPREMARRGRSQLVVTLVLMVVISVLPGVSGWGHLGGAIAGGAAALVLHWQRFGPGLFRWLGVLLLIPIPIASYYHLQRARATSEAWRKIEKSFVLDDKDGLFERAAEATDAAADAYREQVKDVIEAEPQERDAAEGKTAIEALDKAIPSLQELAKKVRRAGPFTQPELEGARVVTLRYVEARLALFEAARDKLRAGAAWDDGREKDFAARKEALAEAYQKWREERARLRMK